MADNTSDNGAQGWIGIYLRGVAMGAADIIPGVSGGTIALITGIYDRLIRAVAVLHPRIIRHVPRIASHDGRTAFVAELRAMEVPFLTVLAAGVGTAVIALSGIMHAALTAYPAPMNALFFGLIAASAVVLYRHLDIKTARPVAAAVIGGVAAFLVTGTSSGGGLGHALPIVFLSGAVASGAMILPGISGAALLYVLGQYEFLTGTLSGFVAAVPSVVRGAPFPVVDAVVIAVFLAGFAVGVLSIARAVKYALDRSREATLAGLIGLMVGALRMPVEEIAAAVVRWDPVTVAVVASAAVAGGAAVLALDKATGDLAY